PAMELLDAAARDHRDVVRADRGWREVHDQLAATLEADVDRVELGALWSLECVREHLAVRALVERRELEHLETERRFARRTECQVRDRWSCGHARTAYARLGAMKLVVVAALI